MNNQNFNIYNTIKILSLAELIIWIVFDGPTVNNNNYILVGMPSETFNLSVIEIFFISPNIMVEGITPDTLERFCHSFLFAGTCYRALNKMATPDINTRTFKYPGYVFAVLSTFSSKNIGFNQIFLGFLWKFSTLSAVLSDCCIYNRWRDEFPYISSNNAANSDTSRHFGFYM